MLVSNNEILKEINTANQEIADGKWQGKEDIFSNRILDIFRINSCYYLESQDYLLDKSFTSSLENLIATMKTLVPKKLSTKVSLQQAIKKISNILISSPLVPGSIEDLTKMDNDVQNGLEIFRKLKEQKFPDIPQMLAKWIKFGGIPLSKLNFSKEELLEVAPFLTYLCIDTRKFSNEEIHEIISKCNNLEKLEINSKSLTQFPALWPSKLVELDCSMCHELEEINNLPEGLKKFLAMSCFKLHRLPEKLPQSMEIFNCEGCEYVSELPNLNEGLKELYFSSTRVEQIPKLPSTLIEMDMRECNCELPDALPDSLTSILADYSGITKLPAKFPPKLHLRISWCEKLSLPRDLSTLQLPPGAKVER